MKPQLDQAGPGWPTWRHTLLVVLVWAAVYLPRLGAGGLVSTEGHRAIPGWEMLRSGEWALPRLFGQVYLRKPPGMPWAVAASSAVFGETELAARLPSALAMLGMSLTGLVFGARWFGRVGGLAAGLATVLTPLFWSSGRSAEIETLNNFATCASVLLVLDMLLIRGRSAAGTVIAAGLLAVSLVLAALAKGPAGFAAIGSAAIVGLILGRGQKTGRGAWWVLIAALAAGLSIGLIAGFIDRAVTASGQHPITQGVSEFLWSGRPMTPTAIGQVVAMAPVALATLLPVSLALLFPWGPDARREAARDAEAASAHRWARALAWTCLLSLALLTALGVHNPRYAIPSLCFIPVLAAYVSWGARGGFMPLRARIARALLLGRGWAWPAVLAVGAAVYIGWFEPRQRATSGLEAGRSLGRVIPDGAMVWSDHMIEARPELLWYAQQAAANTGKTIRPVWVPGMAAMLSLPRPGVYLLLRTDAQSGEESAYQSAGFMDRLEKVWTGRVHKFECALYRMHPLPVRAP